MPVEYKLRTLRRLFGVQSFFRSKDKGLGDTRSSARSVPGSAAQGEGKLRAGSILPGNFSDEDDDADLFADFPENESRAEFRTSGRGRAGKSRGKPPGGIQRPFFHQVPPRAIRNKPVGGHLHVVHLFEKQKMRVYYGAIRDDKFKKYVDEARSCRFNVDAELMRLLEMRLDTVLYRTGFVETPAQARQWICHNQILVNGSPLNIRSAQLGSGDMISIRDRFVERAIQSSRRAAQFREQVGVGATWLPATHGPEGMLPWLVIDRSGLAAIVVRPPSDDEMRAMRRAALFPFVKDAQLNPLAAMRYYR